MALTDTREVVSIIEQLEFMLLNSEFNLQVYIQLYILISLIKLLLCCWHKIGNFSSLGYFQS